MTKQPLPLVDPARTEFGICRTRCDCLECTLSCRHIPGYLIPADLKRMHHHLATDQDLTTWAKEHLRASPGALVIRGGRAFRIPTLVPARRLDGACLFLTGDGQCSIHAVSPFGCAFCDSHMTHSECDHRSKHGLHAVLHAWQTSDLYAQVWALLAADGCMAPAPEIARQAIFRSRK
jgi:hypothetical protein